MTGTRTYLTDDNLRRALGYIMEAGAAASHEVINFAVAFTGSDVVDTLFHGKPLGNQLASAQALVKRHHALGPWSNADVDPAMLEIATGALATLKWLLQFRNAAAHEHWMVESPRTDPPMVVGMLGGGPQSGRVRTTIPTLVTVGSLLSDAACVLNGSCNAMTAIRALNAWSPSEATSPLDAPRDPRLQVKLATDWWSALLPRIDAAKANRLENWDWRDLDYAHQTNDAE